MNRYTVNLYDHDEAVKATELQAKEWGIYLPVVGDIIRSDRFRLSPNCSGESTENVYRDMGTSPSKIIDGRTKELLHWGGINNLWFVVEKAYWMQGYDGNSPAPPCWSVSGCEIDPITGKKNVENELIFLMDILWSEKDGIIQIEKYVK